MKDYQVVFKDGRIGRQRGVEPVTFEQVEDLDQLAARVEKHARKFLLSNDVGAFIENSITRHGKVFTGVRNVAEFDFTVTRVHDTVKVAVFEETATDVVGQPRCSWNQATTAPQCKSLAVGRYELFGAERVLCATHGEKATGGRIGDLTREEVPF